MAVPTLTIRVDWENDGTLTQINDDVSAYISAASEVSWDRGRNSDFTSDAKGRASFSLVNSTADRFTPDRNWHDNPSFEAGTTGWSIAAIPGWTVAATSITQVTDNAGQGGTKAGEAVLPASTGAAVNYFIPYPFRSGVTYSVRVWLKSASGGLDIGAILGVLTSTDYAGNAASITTSWAAYTFTWTPTADRAGAYFLVYTRVATAATVRIDAVQVNPGATANTYIEAPTKGQLVPGRPVHVYATYGGTDYPQFFGYIERLNVDTVARLVNITCYDLFGLWSRVENERRPEVFPLSRAEYRTLIAQGIEASAAVGVPLGNLVQSGSFETAQYGTSGVNVSLIAETHSAPTYPALNTFAHVIASVSAGDTIIVSIGAWTGTTITSVTDTVGTIYTAAAERNPTYPLLPIIYTGVLVATPTSSSLTVTVKASASAETSINMVTLAFRGLGAVDPQGITSKPQLSMGGSMSVWPTSSVRRDTVRLGAITNTDAASATAWTSGYTHYEGARITRGGVVSMSQDVEWQYFTTAGHHEVGWTIPGTSFGQVTALSFQRAIPWERYVWPTTGFAISAISAPASPAVITCAAHGQSPGTFSVVITGSNSTPRVDGTWTATYVDATRFSVPLATDVGGTTGTAYIPAPTPPTFERSTTQKKYGSYSLRTAYVGGTNFGIECAPGGINGLTPSMPFDLAKTYSYSFWIWPTVAATCTVVLESPTGGNGHTQTTGTLTGGTWTEVTGTWTPWTGSPGIKTDVRWRITVPSGAGPTYYDGFTLTQGSTRVLWYPAWLNLAAETDLMQPGQVLSGVGLSQLSQLNDHTGAQHTVTPTMASPFFTYDTRTLATYKAQSSVETFNDDMAEMTNVELGTDFTASGVTVTSGTLVAVATSTAGYGYPIKIDAGTSYASQSVLQTFADYRRDRYSRALARPKMTVNNRFPSMLQRGVHDAVMVNCARLGIVGQKYAIQSSRTSITMGGELWSTSYVLEEHPF